MGFWTGLDCGSQKGKRERERDKEREWERLLYQTRYSRVFSPLHFPHVLAFFLSFRPAGPSCLLVYSLYYAFPARWTGNAKIRRVYAARTRTYKQRPRKRRRVRPVLSEKCYGLVDAIDLAYNEPIKRTRINTPKLNRIYEFTSMYI